MVGFRVFIENNAAHKRTQGKEKSFNQDRFREKSQPIDFDATRFLALLDMRDYA
jgi:hypothetical protein